ncbi:MAG: DoxX family protein [Chloroflexota bacterium]|nr:DoxX family protein [Chloroflexota bacterium]
MRGRVRSERSIPAMGITLLRAIAGFVFFMHGWQKLVDIGIDGTEIYFEMLGIPLPELAAVVVTLVELVGGAALIVGVLTRIAAALLAIDMLVATLIVTLENGFFVTNNGYELTLLLLAIMAALMMTGPGAYAGDNLFLQRSRTIGGGARRRGLR